MCGNVFVIRSGRVAAAEAKDSRPWAQSDSIACRCLSGRCIGRHACGTAACGAAIRPALPHASRGARAITYFFLPSWRSQLRPAPSARHRRKPRNHTSGNRDLLGRVCGLTPVRAARSDTENLPKPANATSSPRFSASRISSRTAGRTAATRRWWPRRASPRALQIPFCSL